MDALLTASSSIGSTPPSSPTREKTATSAPPSPSPAALKTTPQRPQSRVPSPVPPAAPRAQPPAPPPSPASESGPENDWPSIDVVQCTTKPELRDAIVALLRNRLCRVRKDDFLRLPPCIDSLKHSLDCALARGKYKSRGHWHVIVTSQFCISSEAYLLAKLWGEVHVLFFYA